MQMPSMPVMPTPFGSSNTTFSVKSSPSKKATVTKLLSSKHGYLTKRNESSTYTRRYCCIVPHTFLYYFESPSSESPTGIIDLECYTGVERGEGTEFELRGETRNSELRRFFFRAESREDCDEWEDALLKDRHSALIEEREAFKELQSSFSHQLNSCNQLIDDAEHRQRLAEEEAYKLRSSNVNSTRIIKESILDIIKSTTDNSVASQRMLRDAMREKSNTKLVEILGKGVKSMQLEKRRLEEEGMEVKRKEVESSTTHAASLASLKSEFATIIADYQSQNLHLTSRVTALDKIVAENVRQAEVKEAEVGAMKVEGEMTARRLEVALKKKRELAEHKKLLVRELLSMRERVKELTAFNEMVTEKIQRLEKEKEKDAEKKPAALPVRDDSNSNSNNNSISSHDNNNSDDSSSVSFESESENSIDEDDPPIQKITVNKLINSDSIESVSVAPAPTPAPTPTPSTPPQKTFYGNLAARKLQHSNLLKKGAVTSSPSAKIMLPVNKEIGEKSTLSVAALARMKAEGKVPRTSSGESNISELTELTEDVQEKYHF